MRRRRRMSMYSDLFGAFPYERFVVVEGDFPDGMEFSGIVFVSDQWFRTNTGTAQSYLTIITVHETSHQWWYARVGSDQAINPWMDEALAAYSEYIFYEEHYPELKKWWWNFRVDTYVGQNYSGKRVDSTVYDFDNGRDYINAVYLRGAHMLDDLRSDSGHRCFLRLAAALRAGRAEPRGHAGRVLVAADAGSACGDADDTRALSERAAVRCGKPFITEVREDYY